MISHVIIIVFRGSFKLLSHLQYKKCQKPKKRTKTTQLRHHRTGSLIFYLNSYVVNEKAVMT